MDLLRSEIFEAVADSVPFLVADMATGEILFATGAVEKMFGFEMGGELAMGHTVDELVPDAQRTAHANHRADFATNPHVRQMGKGSSLTGRHRDGSEFPVEIVLVPRVIAKRRCVIAVIY